MAGKISEYTNAVATFANGDLVDVSKRISTSPDVFQSQKLEFTQFQAFIQANASNILNTNGLTLGGSFSHNLNSNTLTFTNGTLNIDSNIILNANVNAPNLPTASTGLSAGDFWNENGVVRVGTSGTGQVSIYSANGTLSSDRIVSLGDNKLTFDFNAETASELAPINFEFESGSFDGYTRWSQNGGLTIRSGGSAAALKLENKVGSTNFQSFSSGGGYFGLEASSYNIWRFADGNTANTGIEFGVNVLKLFFGGGVMHRLQQGGGSGQGAHFYEGGISGSLGFFIVGGNSIIGTEKICLKHSTAIKGEGTTGSSALSIYDNQGTPVKLFDFLDNGRLINSINSASTNADLISNYGITLKNTNATNDNIQGIVFEDSSTNQQARIYTRFGTKNSLNFDIRDGNFENAFNYTDNSFNIFNNLSGNANGNESLTIEGQHLGAIVGSGARIGFKQTNSTQYGAYIKSYTFGAGNTGLGFATGFGSPTVKMTIDGNGKVNFSSLPTSSAGLSSGDLYNDSGTLKIA